MFKDRVLKQYVLATLNDWSGEWVHYSDVNKLGINPQQFHLDMAGIYFFPKEFKTAGNIWKSKKYKFTVTISPEAKVLDLSKLQKHDLEAFLDKLHITLPKDQELNIDNFWEQLKNHYSLMKGKNIGQWNADFRKLGFDAIFDDTRAIHSAEVQLVVLNPKIIKIVDVETQNIKRGQFDRVKQHLDALVNYLKPYGGDIKVNVKKETEPYTQGKQKKIVGRLKLFLPNDIYINWFIEEDEANHKIWVNMNDSNHPALCDSWGMARDSVWFNYGEMSEIKTLVDRVMKKVSK